MNIDIYKAQDKYEQQYIAFYIDGKKWFVLGNIGSKNATINGDLEFINNISDKMEEAFIYGQQSCICRSKSKNVNNKSFNTNIHNITLEKFYELLKEN